MHSSTTGYQNGDSLANGSWPKEGEITGTAFSSRKLKIIMLGAGISGIQLAHDLASHMQNFEFEVYEKNHDLGGTWLENRYPGCACDVPAHTYQFSWEPNPRWSKFYAPAPEILSYLNHVVDKHGLRKFMHFSHRATRAEWNEDKSTWEVDLEATDEQGQKRTITRFCDILVQGTGVLNHWKWPEIENLHSFKGTLMHTADWDETVDLSGKTVAVIGNAASAVQCVAALQPDVKKLLNFIRTPSWMLPHTFSDGVVQMDYSQETIERFETDPQYYYEHRLKLEKILAGLMEAMCSGSEAQRQLTKATLDHVAEKIKNPQVLKALKPDFEIGCRRFTPGDHYLRALQQDNVTLITDKIIRVTEKGIMDASGVENEVDVIVCATGFDASYEPRFPILGRNGYSLSENWGKDKATEAYMATLVARFPNHFVFNAPICPLIGSIFPAIEAASSYILQIIHRVQHDSIKSFAVKDTAQTDFNRWVQGRMEHMAWSGNCQSWYKNSKGKVFVPWPGTMMHYAETVSIVRWEDFDFVWNDSSNKYASLGNGVTREGFSPDLVPWLKN